VGALGIVVLRVASKDLVQVSSAEHEREIQDLVADGANEPLSKRIGLGSPNRGLYHPGTLGDEHVIEGPRVLGVSIPDQERYRFELTIHREVPRLLRNELP
jgi:hypothetical protein